MRGWARKGAIQNIIPGKHATIGSTVVVVFTGRPDHQHPVKYGTQGKVIASGNAERYAAKQAIGTTAAMLVEWDVESRPLASALDAAFTTPGRDNDSIRYPLGYMQGRGAA